MSTEFAISKPDILVLIYFFLYTQEKNHNLHSGRNPNDLKCLFCYTKACESISGRGEQGIDKQKYENFKCEVITGGLMDAGKGPGPAQLPSCSGVRTGEGWGHMTVYGCPSSGEGVANWRWGSYTRTRSTYDQG